MPFPSSAPLVFGFDTIRMGEGVGGGWLQAPGSDAAVAVAAFPTAVDRSARLVVTDDVNIETCRLVDPPLAEASRFSLEVFLDSQMPAAAIVELRDPAGDQILTLNLAVSRARLSGQPGQIVTETTGLDPGRWYSVEVVTDGTRAWLVVALEPPGSVVETPLAPPVLGPVGEICLGAHGPPDSAVNFDNLALTNE
jgi:hypothetical protein